MSAQVGAPRAFWCEHALLPGGPAAGVRVVLDAGGRIATIDQAEKQPGDEILPGVTLPGLANTHSHAFHRALRGRTHGDGGTFWTWRERMYHVAARLDPENYLALARATYAEMALAGITAVGEFHYVHHQAGGVPYEDPNEMGHALQQAAAEAGVALTLLDTCYLQGGLDASGHTPLSPEQLRFGDGDVAAWAERAGALRAEGDFRVGAGLHSVRAVPLDQLREAVAVVPEVCDTGTGIDPLHVHISEQPAENRASLEHYGLTPVGLLDEAGLVGPDLTAVHATHLSEEDVRLLGAQRSWVSLCPTTERDLADGIGPARDLHDAGVRLSLGSDQHAVVDLVEEARAVEMHERLTTNERGRFAPQDLLTLATGHEGLGREDAGRLEPGARGDLVTIRLDSVRTAGCDPSQVLLCATAADVTTVVRDGESIVADGRHRLGDVGTLLREAIAPFWEDA
ncbi:formimidoylglutamate deiminase [Brachybacterium endophyticum]|uniref:Formimidoylglutamate deiminase n=1 Tax=Brachybacterium endophyticum TaxID=2182385 RepID=A0A2U2RJR7_9MICO|nr:formimidoylglutamate deiminase [Brachybacterium endophyticum]PWH06024.1 formimidoylglutamate deiminase [Brachybacterium endophyticum]